MNLTTVDARPCDAQEIARQVGKWNILAVSGGRAYRILNNEGETVGLRLPINGTRRVDVVLDWDDTYIVRRIRRIVKGQHANTEVVESEVKGVYCDEVGEAVYQASCWK